MDRQNNEKNMIEKNIMKIKVIYGRIVTMEDHEEICYKCGGEGNVNVYNSFCGITTKDLEQCDVCKGSGKILWIDNIMKKKGIKK